MAAAKIEQQSVLSVDIVNFSNRHIHDMFYIIEKFYDFMAEAIPDGRDEIHYRIWNPANDGGSLSFRDLEDALPTALRLLQQIDRHNHEVDTPTQQIEVRIGLDFGPTFRRRDHDADTLRNWGHGMTIAQHICDLAEPGEILASRRYCEMISLVDNNGRPQSRQAMLDLPPIEVTPRGRWWLKHGYSIEIYNLKTPEVGVQPREAHPWYTPFKAPIDNAVDTYNKMLADHDDINEPKDLRNAFRAAMIAKRLLDLQQDDHVLHAVDIIEKISLATENNHVAHLRHWLFSRLSDEDLTYWLRQAEFKTYPTGRAIFEVDQQADHIYVVVHGTLKAHIGDHIFDELKEGDIFGEMALFTTEQLRTATVTATSKATVLRIPHHKLHPNVHPTDIINLGKNNKHEYKRSAHLKQVLYQHLYASRLMKNTLRFHEVFQQLTDEQIYKFEPSEMGVRLLPERIGDQIRVQPDEVWGEAIGIVVSGSIYASHRNQQFGATYGVYDMIGLNGLQMKRPFDRLEFAPKTQLLLVPHRIIDDVLNMPNEASQITLELLMEARDEEKNHKWFDTLEPI